MSEVFSIALKTAATSEELSSGLANVWKGLGYEFNILPVGENEKKISFELCMGLPEETAMQKEVFTFLLSLADDKRVLYFRSPDMMQDNPPTVTVSEAASNLPPDDFAIGTVDANTIYTAWVVADSPSMGIEVKNQEKKQPK